MTTQGFRLEAFLQNAKFCYNTVSQNSLFQEERELNIVLYQCIPTYGARKVQNTVTVARKTLKQVENCETQSQVVSPNNSTLK